MLSEWGRGVMMRVLVRECIRTCICTCTLRSPLHDIHVHVMSAKPNCEFIIFFCGTVITVYCAHVCVCLVCHGSVLCWGICEP